VSSNLTVKNFCSTIEFGDSSSYSGHFEHHPGEITITSLTVTLRTLPLSLIGKLFCSDYSGGDLMPQNGSNFSYTRRNCHSRRSSANVPHCRRVCANTVAAPVLAAAFCGGIVANQQPLSCLPPFISATNLPFVPFVL
jgi:hypothetical protein